MSFREYLQHNEIEFTFVESIDKHVVKLTAKCCKGPLNIAMILLGDKELFFPSEFRAFTKIDYHYLPPEEAGFSLESSGVTPWPSGYGLKGFASDFLKDLEIIAVELDGGFYILPKESIQKYLSFQEVVFFSQHKVSWTTDQEQPYSLFTHRVIQRLPSINDFPPLPSSVQRLTNLKARKDPNIEDLIIIIESDELLTAQVMMWARSPLYGIGNAVRNVRQAIMHVLGYDIVLNLTLSLSLKKTLKQPREGLLGWEQQWHQSYLTSVLAREIASKKQLPVHLDLVGMGGLLCDIGYFVLGQYFPPHYQLLAEELAANEHIDPCLIEFHNFHFTHQHLGAWLLKVWRFPQEVITAVQWHHNYVTSVPYYFYPYSIFLARYFLTLYGYSDEYKTVSESSDLGLTPHESKYVTEIALKFINQHKDAGFNI